MSEMDDQTIEDDEMIDMILNGATPYVAKQAASIAKKLYAKLAAAEAERDALRRELDPYDACGCPLCKAMRERGK